MPLLAGSNASRKAVKGPSPRVKDSRTVFVKLPSVLDNSPRKALDIIDEYSQRSTPKKGV